MKAIRKKGRRGRGRRKHLLSRPAMLEKKMTSRPVQYLKVFQI
jgi:hypothetical protein